MNTDNEFELIIAVVFAMSIQLGGLVSKYQDLLISFPPNNFTLELFRPEVKHFDWKMKHVINLIR